MIRPYLCTWQNLTLIIIIIVYQLSYQIKSSLSLNIMSDYKFVVLPNGYLNGPRKLTKVLKRSLAKLHKKKVSIVDYIDDLLTMDLD